MREILKERVYGKILKEYGVIGKELRSRKKLRFTMLIRSIEKIHGLLIHWNSWERTK